MDILTNKKISALHAGTVKIGNFIVSRLGLGAMRLTGQGVWGPPTDVAGAKRLLRRAADLDINFIDTADAYGPRVSEELIHDALYPYEGIIIATKGGMLRGGATDWRPDGSPKHLRAACEASLKRLGIERITVYQLHAPDPEVPLETSLRTLMKLRDEGKIRHIGLSNVSLPQLQKALSLTPIVSVQNRYNIEFRQQSEELVNFCEQQGIAFLPYAPISGGNGEQHRSVLSRIAQKHHASAQQIALAWLLMRSPVILPIPGTHSIQHLETNVAAATIQLDEQDLRQLDALSD